MIQYQLKQIQNGKMPAVYDKRYAYPIIRQAIRIHLIHVHAMFDCRKPKQHCLEGGIRGRKSFLAKSALLEIAGELLGFYGNKDCVILLFVK